MAGTGARHLEIGRSGSIGQVLKALKRVGRGSSQAMLEPERGVLTVGLERWRSRVCGWAGLGDCCWCAGSEPGVLTVGFERWRLGVWGWAGLGDCCWCAGFGVCGRRYRQRSRADIVVRVDFKEDDEKGEGGCWIGWKRFA